MKDMGQKNPHTDWTTLSMLIFNVNNGSHGKKIKIELNNYEL